MCKRAILILLVAPLIHIFSFLYILKFYHNGLLYVEGSIELSRPGTGKSTTSSKPLDPLLAQYLAPLWDSVEDTYIRALKVAFCQVCRCDCE